MSPWPAKQDVLNASAEYVCPQKVDYWQRVGVPLVIGRREGNFIWDLDGHRLYDMHLNGGTYNLGHRNPEVIEALIEATGDFDIGNHHFPSVARAELAETFDRLTPGDLTYSAFLASGGEANDLAIKSARHATGRRRVITFAHGFHGATGLATCAGDSSRAEFFRSDRPDEFLTVPFADAEAVERLLAEGDVAAVMLESIPATWGFAVPPPEYLPEVVKLAHEHGALFIADEVQVGLGRTGKLWSVETFGIEPDILVSGKGLSGGVYPIAATVMNPQAGHWLFENGWGHSSTYGGSEIGCRVAQKVLEITMRPETLANIENLTGEFGQAFREIAAEDPYLARDPPVRRDLRFALRSSGRRGLHAAGAL